MPIQQKHTTFNLISFSKSKEYHCYIGTYGNINSDLLRRNLPAIVPITTNITLSKICNLISGHYYLP